jgi:hypothetical protein
MQVNNTITIQSRSVAEIHLHKPRNSCSKTLVVNLPPREMPKNAKKSLLQQVRLKISAKTLEEGANFRPHQVVSER